MLNSLFVKISSIAFAVGVAILGFFHLQVMQPPVHLGVAIPNVAQFFQDSLASSITSSQTTMTLVTGNDQSGNPLVGFFGFVIDEGTSLQEVVTATASGTTITAMTRGLDPIKGLTATTALQFAHRRGASVKITTSPWILVVNQILGGSSTLPASLQYAGHPVAPASTTLEDKSYVDSVATSGAAVAGIGTKGLVAVTTPLGATSTADGATFDYNVIPAVYFSQTSSATATIPITQNNGTVSSSFIDQSSSSVYNFLGSNIYGSSTFNSSTVFQSTTTFNGNVVNFLHSKVFIVSSTFTVPSNITTMYFTLIGGGGGGGGGSGSCFSGGGGGSGGYIFRFSTSTTPGTSLTITIGQGGLGGNAATGTAGVATSIGGISVTGGGGGGVGAAPGQLAGAAGTPNGFAGTAGANGSGVSGGNGASSFSGFGVTGTNAAGGNATGQGSGAAGGGCTGTSPQVGGNGNTGNAIIEW